MSRDIPTSILRIPALGALALGLLLRLAR